MSHQKPVDPLPLIINADDYGLHPQVDRAILHCYEKGALSSASLMVTHSGWQQAAQQAREVGLPLGLHFNVTLGRPVSEPESIPGLVDSRGFFCHRTALLKRVLTGRVKTEEISRELHAQFERFIALGMACDHLDSHQHVHAMGRIGNVLAKQAQAADIPLRLLSPLPTRSPAAPLPLKKRIKRFIIARQTRKQAKKWTKNVRHNDYLVSVFDFLGGQLPSEAEYSSLFASLSDLATRPMAEYAKPRPVVEWMVHPVSCAEAVAGLTRIGPVAEAEYAYLLSDHFRRSLANSQVILTRYGDLD